MPDSLFSNVRLLLLFQGANNSTTTTDSSGTPKTITASGGVKISTAQVKYGTSSSLHTGSNTNYWSVSDNSELTVSGDFTLDTWIYPTAAQQGSICYFPSSTTAEIIFRMNANQTITGLFTVFLTSTATVALNTWSHVAITRSGSTIRGFINGVEFANGTTSTTWDPSSIQVGSQTGTSAAFPGHIFGFRLSNVARWTANFTPPASLSDYEPAAGLIAEPGNFGWTGYQPSFPELQAQPANFGWTGYTPSFPELQAQPGNFGWTGYKPSFDGVLQAEPGSFGWTGYVPSFPELKALPGGFGWTGYQPKFGEPLVALPGSFGWTGYTPSLHPDDIFSRQIIQRRFYCLLGANSKEIPISSISGYYRADNTASFTVVCPDGETYISDILANINSYFKIRSVVIYSDGTTEVVDSVNLNIQQPSYDRGARSFSVTINGTGTFNFPQPRRRHILGDSQLIVESLQVNGLRRFRVLHMPDIYPNDSIVYNNVESVIGRITYTISPRQMTLELTEQG